MAGLDAMYVQVLKGSLLGDCDENESQILGERFRRVVGSIVVMFDTLSTVALARLLDEPVGRVKTTLESLHSVLNVPASEHSLIRLLHPSFRDFLLDKQRCSDPRFWVDEVDVHDRLADNCLRLMSDTLRTDICGLHIPGTLTSELECGKVDDNLPADAQYACRYWVRHLQRGRVKLYDKGPAHEFLEKHFLHWLEALSLVGQMPEAILMVTALEEMLAVGDTILYRDFIPTNSV